MVVSNMLGVSVEWQKQLLASSTKLLNCHCIVLLSHPEVNMYLETKNDLQYDVKEGHIKLELSIY